MQVTSGTFAPISATYVYQPVPLFAPEGRRRRVRASASASTASSLVRIKTDHSNSPFRSSPFGIHIGSPTDMPYGRKRVRQFSLVPSARHDAFGITRNLDRNDQELKLRRQSDRAWLHLVIRAQWSVHCNHPEFCCREVFSHKFASVTPMRMCGAMTSPRND